MSFPALFTSLSLPLKLVVGAVLLAAIGMAVSLGRNWLKMRDMRREERRYVNSLTPAQREVYKNKLLAEAEIMRINDFLTYDLPPVVRQEHFRERARVLRDQVMTMSEQLPSRLEMPTITEAAMLEKMDDMIRRNEESINLRKVEDETETELSQMWGSPDLK